MKTKFTFLLIILTFLSLISCEEDKKAIDVSTINSSFELVRFDREFNQSNEKTFHKLKAKYPYLFPGNEPDSIWLNRKNDSLAQVLYQESQTIFGDFNEEKKELVRLFKHVKYYYSNFKEPKIITLQSNLDLENQIIYADSLLFISLDTYLGKDKIYYSNYPSYLVGNFDKSHLLNDVAMAISYKTVPTAPNRLFLERIIASGKLRYAMQQFLPHKTEAEIMDYSQEKIAWAIQDEERIWKYFVEKEYLYSTNKDLQERFINPAPFSKFYLISDNESPGQIGVWLGLQIVKSFMENNTVSLPEMMAMKPIDIFNKSKYKPKQ
ncbi:MAG TPA: gliding motility lipoprotein GldB [Lutibacter sp.]|nr:gliding motility lipoprotein GldB [Lutibacter sp.]